MYCIDLSVDLKFKIDKGDYNDNDYDNFYVKFFDSDTPNKSYEKYGYNDNLNLFRNKIDNIRDDIWKKIRWYINKYDFTVTGEIINRAFYKYWEMIHEFEIFNDYNSESDIVLHCAEAPGGFIQGSNIFLNLNDKKINKIKNDIDDDGFTLVNRKCKKPSDKYKVYTMSLNKNLHQYKRYNLPSYNKTVINKYVHIFNGADNTGNINNIENIDYIYNKKKNSFYLITCDGGFDEGCNFNNKEQLHYQLILNEIYSSIKLQKHNGHFILKMFDIFTDTSIHLLYLLTLCYKDVYVYKPLTSRPTNSEKYIICKYFTCEDKLKNMFLEKIRELSLLFNKSHSIYKSFTVFKTIPDDFIENIYKINTNIVNRQCEFLKFAIHLCDDSFIDKYDKEIKESMNERKKIFENWKLKYDLNRYISDIF